MKRPDPSLKCERCGRNRWRTVVKRLAWVCRMCGQTRPDLDIIGVTP